MTAESKKIHTKLGEFAATAICGNDILSSCLYVSGIAIIFAGVLAPLVSFFIAIVLYIYKAVYTEVVEALPVNGGAYNCLLNSSSKSLASVAGVMTILSYIATAVLSAKIGIEYLSRVIAIDIFWGTIILLGGFTILVITGIKDSARVAMGIFVFHIVALTMFLLMGGYDFFSRGTHLLLENLQHTSFLIDKNDGIFLTFVFAFSASLLGVSGFESSANFVEEQQHGVFRKTLKNMILGVIIFNPLIALVVLNTLSHSSIGLAKDFLLADSAFALGGRAFEIFISIDAFLVLSGAVLTSFVGVSGLISRMASDGCLPNFLSHRNSRGAHDRVVISFFLLCVSILLITKGELLSLAGVYTISFLGVMTMFAFGNLVMRHTRSDLKRTYRAPLLFVFIAFTATFLGMLGNIKIDPQNFRYFVGYFLPAIFVVICIIYQDYIVGFLLRLFGKVPFVSIYLQNHFDSIISGKFLIFVHHVGRLQEILDYVNKNESGREIILIHCRNEGLSDQQNKSEFEDIQRTLSAIQHGGFYRHLNLVLIHIDDIFSPVLVDTLAKRYHLGKNRVMIGSIHHEHDFDYENFGGVRIIL